MTERKIDTAGRERKPRPSCTSRLIYPPKDPRKPNDGYGGCTKVTCGNSAKIYNSVVEALDMRGVTLQDPLDPSSFRLKRGALRDAKGKCTGVANLSVEVRNGRLVGVTGSYPGQVRCLDKELIGASFEVEQVRVAGLKITPIDTARIRIKESTEVPTIGGPDEMLPAYNMTFEPVSQRPSIKEQPLCSEKKDWLGGLVIEDSREHPILKKETYGALLVQGEAYTSAATAIPGSYWFNIACAGTALAKMRLHGMDPSSPASSVAHRQAALKSLTAKYCGVHSWTNDGVPIYWIGHGEEKNSASALSMFERGPIESRWDGNGAQCISHLRTWLVSSGCTAAEEEQAAEHIRTTCGIPPCEDTVPCRGDTSSTGTEWWTCTAEHVSHRKR